MGVHEEQMYPAVKLLLGIPSHEPIFIIRAQDKLSPVILMAYETAALGANCDAGFLGDIHHIRETFRAWQTKWHMAIKRPD